MKVFISKSFKKSYDKLDRADKVRVDITVEKFHKDPFNVSLNNHKLKGELKDFRSISAGFDLRLLYIEEGGHTIITFIKVGRHREVY